MKHMLKGWLADNAVTTDNKTDKILLLESAGAMNKEDILEKMFSANTGLQPETLRHVVDLPPHRARRPARRRAGQHRAVLRRGEIRRRDRRGQVESG